MWLNRNGLDFPDSPSDFRAVRCKAASAKLGSDLRELKSEKGKYLSSECHGAHGLLLARPLTLGAMLV